MRPSLTSFLVVAAASLAVSASPFAGISVPRGRAPTIDMRGVCSTVSERIRILFVPFPLEESIPP